MRLHRLSVTAFGPFAGTVDIDFDEISSAGLFLIRGATGAGKTSILDAICFALYADVPGARPSGRSLRSDHAPRDVVPEVTVEFTASRRRFRVTRSPEFMRPKRRGDGETKSPARVVLHEQVDGTWVGKDNRHDDVAAVLREVLGMGLEQFSKVVLLPQGEFAAFLRATPEARREVLERLFDVSSYAAVEDWLASERRRTADELAGHQRGLATDLARLADAVADAPVEALADLPDWRELEPHQVGEQCPRLQAVLEAHAAQALAALDAATTSATAATTRLQEAEQAIALQERACTASARLAELDAGGPLHQQARDALAAAARAAAVGGELRALERADSTLCSAAAAAEQSAVSLAPFGLNDRGLDGVAAWTDRLVAQEDGLAEAVRLERAVAERARRRSGLEAKAIAAETSATTLAGTEAGLEQACVEAELRLAEARAAAAALEGLASRLRDAEHVLRVRLEHEEASAARVGLAERVSLTRTHEQERREHLLDLREARLANMAGELAEHLSSGDPCPVCGSGEHPSPAVRTVEVTPDDVAVAEAAWTAAQRQHAALERELVAADTAAAARLELLGSPPPSVETLREAVAVTRSEVEQMGLLARRATALEEALSSARAERASLASRVEALRSEAVGARATLDELERAQTEELETLRSLLETHTRLCPCAASTADTPGADEVGEAEAAVALAAHRRTTLAAQRHVDALRVLAAATESRQAASDAAETSLAADGFTDPGEARAAALPADETTRLQRLCDDYVRARTEAQAVLADPAVQAAAEVEPPDVESLRGLAAQAHSELLQAKDAETLARRTLAAVTRLAADLVRQCEELGPLAERHALVRDLADTFAGTGGNNALRMRLSAFVLAARLEKVAELANERLAVMGDGRYRLQHSDDLAARGARSGLGLRVQDLWTGQTRDTSTLSGGEAFMASLALALGLADAVREESGGFDLQTLFVDEGFGTLDDESLEHVMGVLDGLQEGGRAVGVVSHVAELRTRIPCQVTVHKTESGSTVRVSTAAGSETAA
ncbi:SMC family ATPase [Knoellia sp. p5-6-4]|uniref:AAA family ATPase n=1 Tax=unclassified Knoellia TaxID=2618719 RepID=UPI0023DC30C8|nr:SMC family ATPase [Knoellia sp. p5-6-4]MDF2145600.1 SMC family ATPase [Knoellia sp. p5-6-4]